MRSRVIDKAPNACGVPVTGPSQEYRPCNIEFSCEQAVDGESDDWSAVRGATAPAHVMGLQGDLARLKSLDLDAESGVTGLPRRLHSATLVLTNPFPKGVAASLRLIANLMCARIGANVQLLVEVDRRGELEK